MRLLVVTPRELTGDSRARREVDAARARTLEVVGLCATMPGEEHVPLGDVQVVRVRGGRLSGALRERGLGGMRRSRPLVRELRGLWRLARLAGTTARLTGAARRLGNFDVVHVNDFDALPAGWIVARRSKGRLVYDAHELYAHAEACPPRIYHAGATRLEGLLGRRADSVVTNCALFAAELDRTLQLVRPAVVVLNCPEREDVPDHPRSPRLRAIYQAAGDHEGRPVSDLLDAAEEAPEVDIAIRVVGLDVGRYEREIAARGLEGRVRILPPVRVDEIVSALATFDVGLVINRAVTPNVELAVPGKLFEYMMGGLAVAVPDLPGMKSLVEEESIGVTFPAGSPTELGAALAELAASPERLAEMRRRARKLAVERYNAETQAEVLASVWGLAST